jgi:hypothetical protein
LLLQMLYSIRGERMQVEQLEYNLWFRRFAALGRDRVWDGISFSKNLERLLSGEVAQVFFASAVASARQPRLLAARRPLMPGLPNVG